MMIYGVTILHIIAVFASILFLAYLFRVSLVEAMPVFTCLLIFVLYALAMVGRLSWIDGIAAAAIVSFGIMLAVMRRERRKHFGKVCLDNVTQPSFLTAVFLLTVVVVCTSGKAVTWWDDINFWAADVKALYFLDGFAGKYANVASEFGDYPPAAQLMKWWFLHLNPREYQEGLAFAGYYALNLVFMLPLLRGLKGRNAAVMAGMAAALWFLPSIAEVYGYDGFCADLTMACIYGSFLYAVTDTGRETGIHFYDVRLALYLGILVLVKSIGFVWALWHLPLFWIEGTYHYGLKELGILYVLNFLIGVIPLGFLTTWVYVKNNRSMLACIIFHLFVNTMQEKIAMTPQTKCVETIIIFFAAAMIVLANKEMFFEKQHIGNLLTYKEERLLEKEIQKCSAGRTG